MAKKDFAFGKENFILIAGAVVLFIIGFILMCGGGSGDNTFLKSKPPGNWKMNWARIRRIS